MNERFEVAKGREDSHESAADAIPSEKQLKKEDLSSSN